MTTGESTTVRRTAQTDPLLRSDRLALAAIVAIGLVLRLVVWALVPNNEFARSGDEYSYYRAGMRLVILGEPDLYWAPMMGWVIAGLSGLLGTELLQVFRGCWVVLDVLNLVLIYGVGQKLVRLSGTVWRGFAGLTIPHLAAAVYAVYLPAIGYATHLTSEVLSLLWLLAAFNLWDLRPPLRLGRAVAGGLCASAMILTRPALGPFAVAMAVAVIWSGRRSRPLFRTVLLPALVMIVTALVGPGSWVARNYFVTGYPFLNLSYVSVGVRFSLEDFDEDPRFLQPRPTLAEAERRKNLVERQKKFARQLAALNAAPTRADRRKLLDTDFINRKVITPKDVFAFKAEAIGAPSSELRFASPVEQGRRWITRVGRTLAPKNGVFDLMSRDRKLSDPLKLTLFGLANVEWGLVLMCGIAGLLASNRLTAEARLLLVAAIAGCFAAVVAHGEPRYSFPFEYALIIAGVAFACGWRESARVLWRSWRLRALFLALGLFIAWIWAVMAIWGFSDSIRGVW